MEKIRKLIGNILLVIGILSVAFMMCCEMFGWEYEISTFGPIYAIGIIGGGILRIGDFFKWRAKKYQQGINEAKNDSANSVGAAQFCPHCGKALASKTAFCPHCGKALN